MIQHFLYGPFDRIGYQVLKTPLVARMLTRDHLQMLIHIGDRNQHEELKRTWFPYEQVLAYSLIIPRKDAFNRHAVWNHTLLLTFHDYIRLSDEADITKKLHDLFIREPISPQQFQPLKVTQ